MRPQRLTSSLLTLQITAEIRIHQPVTTHQHHSHPKHYLIASRNDHINVASCHTTHFNIDNGQIVARLDQSVITEKEITRVTANNSGQPCFSTTISEVKQQQQFATVE